MKPLVASLLLVAMPRAPSSFLFLVVRPGAPSSVLDEGYLNNFEYRFLASELPAPFERDAWPFSHIGRTEA